MTKGTLNTDGASRGNPGPAGMGFTLVLEDGTSYHGGCYIGEASNNVAEYSALLWGLENAKAAGVDDLCVEADSELMVNQLTGVYRVKNEGLKPLFAQARVLIGAFKHIELKHVYREKNSAADTLANEGIDKRGKVGDFLRHPALAQSLFDFSSAPSVTKPQPVEDTNSLVVVENNIPCADKTTLVRKEDRSGLPMKRPSNGGIYELTVKEHFDAAHALDGYPGQCKNLHGHTWDVEVSVEGMKLDSIGILYDFKSLKSDLKSILDEFDHAYLNDLPVFKNMNSTAENLARVIFEQLEVLLPKEVRLTEVCIWESPVARLRYRRADA